MANPAPTINQINAFNATQGTTIDFNIIGGTELVRSNRIYIYDLSDNSLICTHLYVSTESIHELPPNTDGSIVYESGKSSADFVNGAQYYAQIQTFTDIAGTEGGSGLSVAKMFWCLVDPTLTIDAIPSTISTTSYNVSATYNANTSVVSNIIQQYQFSLYSATGSLLQSSGVVVGSGEQQGTSTAYDISYNFSGLSVGSSYYVAVDVTTTQGMSVSAQSNTFTVSIDTPTLGEATVVNNACDGYISVTSNLSGEYGGSASGEIVSFETDSENVFTKLQVDLEPLQDLHGYDKPWAGGGGANLLNSDYAIKFTLSKTITFPQTILSGTKVYIHSDGFNYTTPPSSGNKYPYYVFRGANNENRGQVWGVLDGSVTLSGDAVAIELWSNGYDYGASSGVEVTISGLTISKTEQTTYSPYANICPITGWTGCEVDVTGENLIKVSAESYDNSQACTSSITDSGVTVTATGNYARRMDAFAVKTGQTYTVSFTGKSTGNNNAVYLCKSTDWNDRYGLKILTSTEAQYAYTFTADTDVFALGWYVTSNSSSGEMTITNLQLEQGSPATDYVPHNPNSAVYPVSWQTEAGTVYGGTVDLVTGVLTVTHSLLDMSSGSFAWSYDGVRWQSVLSGLKNYPSRSDDLKFERYGVSTSASSSTEGMGFTVGGAIYIYTSNGTDAPSGNVWYPLATPQTYQLTPTQIHALLGQNNVWADCGDVAIEYNILITNLLVKRKDLSDVSGTWLTLYEKPILQASDMDFTYIDFLNQYGKTYQYALVPLLIQSQSGVVVEVEGGYTVSDNVLSQFDYVFITDVTGSEKLKANVGYGNVNMSQNVGSILPIGAKYPVVVTNSHNAYHSGSISGYIVPDDFYTNGNLSRVAMVAKRDELEQFLVNKKPKIIKDWNGKIWLVMITGDVDCSFDSNYGMGMVTFTASWVEVGDATNQEDLQNTGLINVGGV